MSNLIVSHNTVLAQATRKVKDREITYTLKSPTCDSVEVDGRPMGTLVRITMWHDADKKPFMSSIALRHYDQTIELVGIYDRVNYPFATLIYKSVKRYSDKALAEFETEVIGILTSWARSNEVVRDLWLRATEIAMGGDGTLRYSEAVSM
jgi:hypothetical protein